MSNEMRGIRLMKALTILLILSAAVFALSPTLMHTRAQPMTTFKVEPVNSYGGLGETVAVDINVSDAEDFWGWQVFMTWDNTTLQYASLSFGDFLAGQPDGTAQMAMTAYADDGWLMCSETTFGTYPGVTAASGWLVSINFTVIAEGGATIDIDSQYTFWQDSTLEVYGDGVGEMIKDNGYYRTLVGDIDGDGDVDPGDFYLFSGAYGTSPPSDSRCDLDNDGDVDPGDFYLFSGAYGTSI
jgi:hypothetical protein